MGGVAGAGARRRARRRGRVSLTRTSRKPNGKRRHRSGATLAQRQARARKRYRLHWVPARGEHADGHRAGHTACGLPVRRKAINALCATSDRDFAIPGGRCITCWRAWERAEAGR